MTKNKYFIRSYNFFCVNRANLNDFCHQEYLCFSFCSSIAYSSCRSRVLLSAWWNAPQVFFSRQRARGPCLLSLFGPCEISGSFQAPFNGHQSRSRGVTRDEKILLIWPSWLCDRLTSPCMRHWIKFYFFPLCLTRSVFVLCMYML